MSAAAKSPARALCPRGEANARQAIWDVILRYGPAPFSVAHIQRSVQLGPKSIRNYLKGLEAAGYLRKSIMVGHWTLLRSIGAEAPRVDKQGLTIAKGRPEEQMWRALKFLRGDWSHHDLAVMASLEDSPVTPEQASDYAGALLNAGYLTLRSPKTKAAPARYRAIQQKITGPLAPISARIRVVFDPNLGEIVWHPPVES